MRLVIAHIPSGTLLVNHAFEPGQRAEFDTACTQARNTMKERTIYATVILPGRSVVIPREIAAESIIRIEE